MRRRDLLFGLAASSTLRAATADAQQRTARQPSGTHVRRVGALMTVFEQDPQARVRVAMIERTFQEAGWKVGEDLLIDYRWPGNDQGLQDEFASQLVAVRPDVLIAGNSALLRVLQRRTDAIPIVFLLVPDPLETGLVKSMMRPGGMITGFTNFEFRSAGKWLEYLVDIDPEIKIAGLMIDPVSSTGPSYVRAIESVADRLGVTIKTIAMSSPSDIELGVSKVAALGRFGLITPSSSGATRYLNQIISVSATFKCPSIYPYRYFAAQGGLMSYGIDESELYVQAAGYVHRILNGESPGDLPIQTPKRYELVVNLKAAAAIGLKMPEMLLAIADEVIE